MADDNEPDLSSKRTLVPIVKSCSGSSGTPASVLFPCVSANVEKGAADIKEGKIFSG